jgi:hypothetical protein
MYNDSGGNNQAAERDFKFGQPTVDQGQINPLIQGKVIQGQVPQGQVIQGQVPQGQVIQGQVPQQGQMYQGQVPQQGRGNSKIDKIRKKYYMNISDPNPSLGKMMLVNDPFDRINPINVIIKIILMLLIFFAITYIIYLIVESAKESSEELHTGVILYIAGFPQVFAEKLYEYFEITPMTVGIEIISKILIFFPPMIITLLLSPYFNLLSLKIISVIT